MNYQTTNRTPDETASRTSDLTNSKDDLTSGNRVITYSPSWTFITTHFCRDTCGYCAFVNRTAGDKSKLQPLAAAEREIKSARTNGATELLIMSGEAVESSHAIRRALNEYGFANYIEYLIAVAQLALAHDLLPHINIGNLSETEIGKLKPFVPSMGAMLESVDERLRFLPAHIYAPSKTAAKRIDTLRAAGRAKMAWTTGLLIGIGETAASRRETLETIACAHQEYGHVQEVIIQPFTAHTGTKMSGYAAPSAEDLCATVKLARLILPSEITVQIPPNIAPQVIDLVQAGARDFGGISPDGDRINPSHKWLLAQTYQAILQTYNFTLQPRLAIYPAWTNDAWLSSDLLLAAKRAENLLPIP